mgnify:CR=1 FL=1
MIDFNDIAALAAQENDLTQEAVFAEREPLKAGNCLLRFREYIELGMHEGSAKFPKPKEKAKLVFEVVTKKHVEEDAEGKKIHRVIEVYINKGSTAKAGDRKIFNAMNASLGGGHKHIAEMLGKGFKAKITNSTPAKEGDRIYSNLDEGPQGAKTYTFTPPFQIDPDEGEFVLDTNGNRIPLTLPEMKGEAKLFLWEMAGLSDEQIKAMWESLYIEGEWEAKEADGDKPAKEARSKNVIQEKIMANLSWAGSRTEGLTQSFVELDELTNEPVEDEEPEVAAQDLSSLAGSAETTPKKEAEVIADIEDIPGLD